MPMMMAYINEQLIVPAANQTNVQLLEPLFEVPGVGVSSNFFKARRPNIELGQEQVATFSAGTTSLAPMNSH